MKRILKIVGIIVILVYFVGNILPNLIGIPLAAYHSYQSWQEVGNIISEDNQPKISSINQSYFKNGIWIHEKDSLAGIEIKNGKWIMFYKGTEIDSNDIYDFKIKNEDLILTNYSDTLNYSLLQYNDTLLSLVYKPRGNTLNYRPENINSVQRKDKTEIICSDDSCEGFYKGPEFIDGSDIAHQFSNKMSNAVGDKLKELYKKGEYSKVDFSNISMTTEGMGSGIVTYKLSIPFMAVKEKCDAYTSFDHVGGWNHEPDLSKRRAELSKALVEGHSLDISDLKTTPEGLQEYWIQWKNKIVQSSCK